VEAESSAHQAESDSELIWKTRPAPRKGNTMPEVLTFWQFAEEESTFLQFLQRTGTVLAFPGQWVQTREELVPQPIQSLVGKSIPSDLRFSLEPFAVEASLEIIELEGQQLYGISLIDSCVLDYTRGRFRGKNKPGFSNLYAYFTTSRKQEKDPQFVKWVKKNLSRGARHNARMASIQELSPHSACQNSHQRRGN